MVSRHLDGNVQVQHLAWRSTIAWQQEREGQEEVEAREEVQEAS